MKKIITLLTFILLPSIYCLAQMDLIIAHSIVYDTKEEKKIDNFKYKIKLVYINKPLSKHATHVVYRGKDYRIKYDLNGPYIITKLSKYDGEEVIRYIIYKPQ